MKKPLKLGELRKIIHSYVAFDGLCDEHKSLVADTVESIFEQVKTCYFDYDDDTDSKAYAITIEEMLATSDYTFDCFLYDNGLEVAFGDMAATHEQVRASLLMLHLVAQALGTAEQIRRVRHRGRNSMSLCAQFYTGLGLGVHESGAWGGRKVVCSKDYPFERLRQLSLKNISNLAPIDYTKEQANNELLNLLSDICDK